MSGSDYLVYLSADRTSAGADTVVETQGDLTINPGKPIQRTGYKQSSKASQGNDGWSCQFSFGAEEPLGAGQMLVLDAVDNGGDQHITIRSATTGTVTWEGPIKLTVASIEHPISGDSVYQVECHENGTVARGTAA